MNAGRRAIALIVLCLTCSSTAFAEGVTDLRAFYQRTQTLQSEFRQLRIDEQGAVTQSQEGRFWMERPAKLHWVYERPYRQVMVNDGKRFWLYDEDLSQVTVRVSDEALQSAPLLLLGGGPGLDEAFVLAPLPFEEGMDWVGIEPRKTDGDFKRARIALKDGLPRRLELEDSLGQTTRIEFLHLRQNGVIDPARFRFQVPPGTEVVGQVDEP